MDGTLFKNIAEGIGALITTLALLAAGVIFLWKREWQPRIQLRVDIDSFSQIGDAFLVEPVCIVENKGLLRCVIHRHDFSVRYLRQDDALLSGDKRLLGATIFPHEAAKVQFVKPEWQWGYVEAGICLRYSHVIHLPTDTVAILVWTKIYHRKQSTDDFFAAQKIFPVLEGKLIRNHEKEKQ